MEENEKESIVLELYDNWTTHFSNQRNLIETKESLSKKQIYQYLISLLDRDPFVFLEKYGEMLSIETIKKFQIYDTYEVNWLIDHILHRKQFMREHENDDHHHYHDEEELHSQNTPSINNTPRRDHSNPSTPTPSPTPTPTLTSTTMLEEEHDDNDLFTLQKQLQLQQHRRQQQNHRSQEELKRRNRRFKAMQHLMESSTATERQQAMTPYQPNPMPTAEEWKAMTRNPQLPEGPISSSDDHIGGAVDAADKEYFTKDSMMMRRPELYRDYIGKWDPQGLQRPLFRRMKLYERLLTNMDLEETIQNTSQQDSNIKENEQIEEEEEEEESDDNNNNSEEVNDEITTETMDVSNHNTINMKNKNDNTEIEIDDNDKDFMEKEFLKEMKDHFIFGEDEQYFDYSKYDNNIEWDDLKQREIDEEERYFQDLNDECSDNLQNIDAVNEDDQSSNTTKRDTASDEELEDWEKDIW